MTPIIAETAPSAQQAVPSQNRPNGPVADRMMAQLRETRLDLDQTVEWIFENELQHCRVKLRDAEWVRRRTGLRAGRSRDRCDNCGWSRRRMTIAAIECGLCRFQMVEMGKHAFEFEEIVDLSDIRGHARQFQVTATFTDFAKPGDKYAPSGRRDVAYAREIEDDSQAPLAYQ